MTSVTETINQDDEINLADLVKILQAYKNWLWQIPALTTALGLAYALLATPIFEATTSILPPQQQQSGASALLSQLGGLGGLAGAAGAIKNPADMYLAMLKSRSVGDEMIRQFELRKVYETDTQTDTLKQLSAVSKFSAGKDGLITIAVEDESPQRSAAMANAYVGVLRSVMSRLAVTEAQQRRLFFETQLKQNKERLSTAENALRKFQQSTGMLDIKGDGQVTIEATAKLRAQVTAKELEISGLRQFAADGSPQLQRAQAELTALQGQLKNFSDSSNGGSVFSRSQLSTTGLEYVRLLREMKYQELLFEMLAKQWEVAKLDEAKEGANIQVLDAAVVPERKIKPKRSLILMISALAGLMLALAAAFVSHFVFKRDNLKV